MVDHEKNQSQNMGFGFGDNQPTENQNTFGMGMPILSAGNQGFGGVDMGPGGMNSMASGMP